MKTKTKDIHIRITEEHYNKIISNLKNNKAKNITDYVYDMIKKNLNTEKKHDTSRKDDYKRIYEEKIFPLFQGVKELHNKYIASGKQDVELLKKLYTEMGKACTKTSDILISMMDTEQQILYQSFSAYLNSEEYHKYLKAIDKK